ncbi:hypothetical protein ACQCSX_15430 [Pseudarthrobacter sp. P1]|uniref:hypothetical protein n=1 Tax=Pseudarthrobacter sp. P1 TaxID=3418418 RepID=UPI003CF6F3B5
MAQISSGRGKGKPNPALRLATEAAFDEQGHPKPAIQRALLQAVEVQRPLVLANLRRLRRKHPHATPYELSLKLERDFLTAVGGGGAAIGATAIIPGLGTVASLSISAAATVVFLEATALYAQSVAELHGVRLQDPERSRLAVMAIMLGEEGTAMLSGLTGHALGTGRTPMQAWGTVLGKSVPLTAVRSISSRMQKAFLKKVALQSGSAMIGRAIPFGIGAVVGGAGNYLLGRAVVASTKAAFGPAPMWLPQDLAYELDAPRPRRQLPALPKAIEARLPGKKPGRKS